MSQKHNITVTLVSAEIIIIGSRYQFFDVDFTFDVDTLKITCTFLNTMTTNTERSCTVMFGLGKDINSCRNLSQSLRSEQNAGIISRISVDLPIPLNNLISDDMCLVVRASVARQAAEVKRMLTVVLGTVIYKCTLCEAF